MKTMPYYKTGIARQIALLLLLVIPGCAGKEPVRHLTSDVCLINPGVNTKKDVAALMGQPDKRYIHPKKGETWIYYQVKKSFRRKLPYIGKSLGHEEYEVVTFTFSGDTVRTCLYRAFDEDEFKQSGIETSEQPGSQ